MLFFGLVLGEISVCVIVLSPKLLSGLSEQFQLSAVNPGHCIRIGDKYSTRGIDTIPSSILVGCILSKALMLSEACAEKRTINFLKGFE